MTYDFLLTDPEGRLLNLQDDNSFQNHAPECHKGILHHILTEGYLKLWWKEKKGQIQSLKKTFTFVFSLILCH